MPGQFNLDFTNGSVVVPILVILVSVVIVATLYVESRASGGRGAVLNALTKWFPSVDWD
jgi:hypothetical protein